MFVAAELPLSISADSARIRLANLVSGGLLDAASRATYLEQGVALVPVGPVRRMTKLARVQMRQPASRGDTSVVVLRWEAAGAAGNLFPVLDADLTIAPAGEGSAVLRLDGVYRPPLGALGAGLDRVLLRHVATATARAFIGQVAGLLTNPAGVTAVSPAAPARTQSRTRPQPPGAC